MPAQEPAIEHRHDGRATDTRARIHQIALELFVAQGFAATTMQDIADRLGLTKSALYYHHPTKADLVSAVVQPAIEDVNAFLEDARRSDPSAQDLLERFFDLNHRHRPVFLALLRDPSGLAAVDARNWVPRLADEFQDLLAGPDAGHWQRICAVMAANGLSRCATLLTDVPYDQLRAMSVAAALATLRLEEPTSP